MNIYIFLIFFNFMKMNPLEFLKSSLVMICLFCTLNSFAQTAVSGQLKVWYPVMVTIDGPIVDES